MPRNAKKQTRLAFANAAPSRSPNESEKDRYARLSYQHPTLGTVRLDMARSKSRSSLPAKVSALSSKFPREKPSVTDDTRQRKGIEKGKRGTRAISMEESEEEAAKAEEARDGIDTHGKSSMNAQQPEDSSEDEIVVPGSSKRARHAVNTDLNSTEPAERTKAETSGSPPPNSRKRAITIESTDEEDGDGNDSPKPRRRLKRRADRSSVVLSDSDDSEPVVSSPVKRQRRISPTGTPQTPHTSRNQDQQELEDDVKDLRDSVVKETRTRGGVYESARDKKLKLLETLRRRRAGHKVEDEEEPENEASDEDEDVAPRSSPTRQIFGKRLNYDDDSDAESEMDANEDLDRYDDDFVMEDTELGVPTEEIPLEFTRHAYKQPREYFRDVVGWMVHNCINPAFPRDDAMYRIAFQKLGDEVKGRAGSSLISSAWTPRFRQVLLARPHLEITSFPTSMMHSCDACNRSGHPASSDLKFYGKPYFEETLEPLNEDSSDSSDENNSGDDEDESGVERDRDGNVLPEENARFYLGKTCRANAYMAHLLTHWKFQLNEWVVDYLRRMGQMEDSEILRRANMSQKRSTRNAIGICKKMEEDGEIERLYRDFHIHLKTAREKTSTMELLGNMD
ncbi:hypothetical protein N7539_002656 [Penicillium diatomitis]|uniref:DUF4211 domain-containing protein n=1 Tax=Penicillium diatomitis TaxID=2819901 RepID=A0A9W9XF80_9EURO|nr:uncharacterized protein N7539_002656 [Penicillium diatomitis]KAJ5491089.1 hypothetical protein N7539_002656 [Penicillium diatomitis]